MVYDMSMVLLAHLLIRMMTTGTYKIADYYQLFHHQKNPFQHNEAQNGNILVPIQNFSGILVMQLIEYANDLYNQQLGADSEGRNPVSASFTTSLNQKSISVLTPS